MNQRLLLRPREAFEMIGISRSKGYTLLAEKSIPSIRIGKSIRIPIDSLQEWVKQQLDN